MWTKTLRLKLQDEPLYLKKSSEKYFMIIILQKEIINVNKIILGPFLNRMIRVAILVLNF